MQNNVCDICKTRPAKYQITRTVNGRKETINVCEEDYRKLRASDSSLGGRLFGGSSLFDSFFDDDFGSIFGEHFPETFDSRAHQRSSVDIDSYMSENAKNVIQKAAEVAVELGSQELDTEHLLHALSETEVVDAILKQFKIDSEELRKHIETEAKKNAQVKPSKTGEVEVSITPRVKSILERSLRVAQELQHGYIGPEHLLIATAEEEGFAGEFLRKFGLTPEALRQKTLKVVGKGAKEGSIETPSNTPKLDQYGRDLTKLAAEGKLDPVIGREEIIEQTIEVLARRRKNNPVLIGEPGVGKTAIVEGLAQKIHNNEVPEVLKGKRVVELSLNAMVAGSKYRGEFEERIKDVIDEIVNNQDQLIIFIDEVHTIVGAGQGGGEGGLDVSNVIKPHLARGEMHLIGATTLNEYQKYIEKDSALERRFQPVLVPEPTVEQTIEILRGLRDKYEAFHKVKILDEALVAAAELSDRYITNRYLPDKAIDIIDQAASKLRIRSDTYSKDIRELEEKIKKLKKELESATAHKKFDEAKKIEEQIKKLESELIDKQSEWRMHKGKDSIELTAKHVAEVVSAMTGVPVKELTQTERENLLKLEEKIAERVVGQRAAVEAVSNAIRVARAGLSQPNKPIATFLFLGPTGVGKTELAKALAWAVFGDEKAIIRIDMSEYMEKHSVARLIGAPPGYVGYEEAGQLTEKVRRNPYSVVLLDEIEKAHPDVTNVLLQVFDDGRLTDGKGRVVDFSNTLIIATSNIGAHLIHEKVKTPEDIEKIRPQLMEMLNQHFRPEFLNRIDDIIIFHPLSKEHIKEIVAIELEKLRRILHGQGIVAEFDKSLIEYLAEKGFSEKFGARELKRVIKSELEQKLAQKLLAGDLHPGESVVVSYKDGDLKITKKKTSKKSK